ncbi:GNAT family N-acetyltransferase [Patescibacteria group bacterium]|nr:GNAT family N-acetyltransferase [Patescibacteria group bacterium]MBU1921861.1 GNAT family N-acetyltransferase [Patescibacteria group bacterium]
MKMNPPITISQTDLSELEQIVELNRAIFDKMYENAPYSLRHYQKKLERKKPFILAARADGRLVGDSIAFEKDGAWYIWVFGVAEQYRGQGIGAKLLERNERFAGERGYDSITAKVFNVSCQMQRLLIGRGYRVVGLDLSEVDSKYNAVHFELKI